MPVIRVYAKSVYTSSYANGKVTNSPLSDTIDPVTLLDAYIDKTQDTYAVFYFDDAQLAGYRPTGIAGGIFCKDIPYGAEVTKSLEASAGNNVNAGSFSAGAWKTYTGVLPVFSATTGKPYNYVAINIHGSGSSYYLQARFDTGFQPLTNAPYFDVDCYVPEPMVKAVTPGAGFVDKTNQARFAWQIGTLLGIYGLPVQTAAKFRWRPQGATEYTEIDITGNDQSCTVPADTFEADYIEWQVLVQTDGGWSDPSDWATVTTIDVTPQAAQIVLPKNEYVETDKEITFDWEHVIDTGTAQTKADLEYSEYGGAWQTLISVMGPDEHVAVPASTLPSGQLRWRVRTYNLDGVAGDWSEPAAFIGIGAPAMPVIYDVSQSSRPVVSWQATGQYGYQLQAMQDDAVIWDSGEISGVSKQIKIMEYLPSGTYVIRVRVIGQFTIWSDWAEYMLVLAMEGPEAPTLTAAAVTAAAELTFSAPGAEKAYILRDGIPIADVTGLETYTDYAALGSVAYVLRAVDSGDNYTDSIQADAEVSVPCPTLAAVDALSDYEQMDQVLDKPQKITGETGNLVSYRHYAGRKNPVAIFAGQKNTTYEIMSYYQDAYERDRLLALIDRCKTMLYRDDWGNKWYITVGTARTEQDGVGTVVAITMTVTDHGEAIDYAEV